MGYGYNENIIIGLTFIPYQYVVLFERSNLRQLRLLIVVLIDRKRHLNEFIDILFIFRSKVKYVVKM
jgi:hypothetical protein